MNGISVVIISRGRVKLLEELIMSVKKAQKKASIPTEIVLVDSSQGDDKSRVSQMSIHYSLNYFYADITVSGKRNLGAKKALYDYILFLDSDCIATEDIFTAYARTLTRHPDAAGSCGPLEFFGNSTWVWKIIECTPYTIFFSVAKWGETFVWAPTANLLVKKDVFFEVGCFDEKFPKNPGGEDVDLGLRINQAGYTMYSTPDALVYHSKDTWSSLISMFKRVFNYGRGDFSLAEKHTQMTCESIPRRIVCIVFGMIFCLLSGILIKPWLCTGAVLVPFYEILMTSLLLKEGDKRIPFRQRIFVQLLFLWNEVGFIKGCFERKKLSMINRQFIHFKPQMDGNCYRNFILSVIYEIFIAALIILSFVFG